MWKKEGSDGGWCFVVLSACVFDLWAFLFYFFIFFCIQFICLSRLIYDTHYNLQIKYTSKHLQLNKIKCAACHRRYAVVVFFFMSDTFPLHLPVLRYSHKAAMQRCPHSASAAARPTLNGGFDRHSAEGQFSSKTAFFSTWSWYVNADTNKDGITFCDVFFWLPLRTQNISERCFDYSLKKQFNI